MRENRKRQPGGKSKATQELSSNRRKGEEEKGVIKYTNTADQSRWRRGR